MDNLDVIFEILQKYIGGLAGLFTSAAVIWKVFGPKVKGWISSTVEDIIKAPIDSIRSDLNTIAEHVEDQKTTDIVLLGYTILKDLKAIEQGEMQLDEYRFYQLDAMYTRYDRLGGNGVVHLAWENFIKNVEIKQWKK